MSDLTNMPTPSEVAPATGGQPESANWEARPAMPPRSIFSNYRPRDGAAAPDPPAGGTPSRETEAARCRADAEGVRLAVEFALARSWLYRFLAQAFEDPTAESWANLASCRNALESAVRTLAGSAPALAEAARGFGAQLDPAAFERFLTAYLAAFGHAARGRCPINEIEYGDLKADALFQPHRLADLAAFYRAFGLEVTTDAGERQDHLCLELEFMCVLTAKEAYALQHHHESGALSLCRDAQKRFLREHLGRWAPAFARRLAELAGDISLIALANLTRIFVETECALHGLIPGSEDQLLRPVEEGVESMCGSCGVGARQGEV
jgi:putative dimethyl sulfoxide reductase chaperone